LKRVARVYGSDPQFICCSATIANPGELASQLIEKEVKVVDENGAPAGEKLFVFCNPPMVNRNLGIRRSYINEATRVAKEILAQKLQTIVFANSRLHTEVLLTYLQQAIPPKPGQPEPIRGYRGGYLPGERRQIEHGLRNGRILGVVATNALELGIDVGSLDACVIAGYPGTIASTWQRAGRAGRRGGSSCAVFVASSAPLDQFIVRHPDYFFGSSPEQAHVQPDNLEILVNHLKCAAFELPISPDERFGNVNLPELCEQLGEAGFLHQSGGHWHWIDEAYPADTISLRSVTSDNFVIIDRSTDDGGKPEVIGEVDFSSALTTVHPKAIYLHQGQQYHVEYLDFDKRKAYVKPVNVDYFTDAIRYTQVRVLEVAEEETVAGPAARAHGDVLVRSQVVGFKKIKFFTNENVGSGKLELPENEMHTTSFWVTLGHSLLAELPFSSSERQSGIFGLLYVLGSMATLLMMCDRRDLGTAVGERPPSTASEINWEDFATAPSGSSDNNEFFEPNLYIYDAYPGGIGFSEPLYRACDTLLKRTFELISACPCENGCPSCVGPAADRSERTKEVALEILGRLCREAQWIATRTAETA
jgi:DEAD/DEAH box helicase domain-containing protein